jgi:predicted DNA-binding ribbon-helix-helix protein
MCQIFAKQPVESYEPETRSIRLDGHATSIRLERAFWVVLEEIAASQGVNLSRFLNTLHTEVLELHGECNNFASLLRCSCLKYAHEIHGRPAAERALEAAGVADFAEPKRLLDARAHVNIVLTEGP